MKPLFVLSAIGGLLFLGSRLLGAKRLSDHSVVRTLNPRLTGANLQGISLATEVYLDNPTNASVTMTRPVVTLTSGGTYLASSVPSTETFRVTPQSQTSLGTTEILIPWTALAPFVAGVMQQIPRWMGKSDLAPESLGIQLEYAYTVYIDGVFYQSPVTKIV